MLGVSVCALGLSKGTNKMADQTPETEVEDIDPNDVALAIASGLCGQQGMDADVACMAAWMHGVPAFFNGRQAWYEFMQKQQQAMAAHAAQQRV